MAYNSDTLKIINETWLSFKVSTNTSQVKAAKAMGMNQSAFSQYLRGDIPLNTDFIAKFTALTNTDIAKLVPQSAIRHVSMQPISIRYTLSGRRLSNSFELIPSPVNLDHAFAISVDYSDFILERGTLLLVDTIAEIREHDTVIFINKDKRPIYGVISYIENEWQVLEPHYFGGNRFFVEKSMEVNRVSGSFIPPNLGRVFKNKA